MPYSREEILREMESPETMGALFSFPSAFVQKAMAEAQVKADLSQVDRLWTAYEKGAVEQGIPAYGKAKGGANAAAWLTFLTGETGYSRNLVAAWLNALEKVVTEQGFDWKWLDPAAARAAGLPLSTGEAISQAIKSTGEAAGNLLRPTLDPVTNLVKYAAIAVVAGAVIYGIYHGSRYFKRKRG
jgi:hypothetical protein